MLQKIFGIGLSKTGTTSLHVALETLGYTSVHYPVVWEEFEQYDAASDITVAYRFEKLDRLYPNSKFILTLRDLNKWLESCEKFFVHQFNAENYPPKVGKFYLEQIRKTYGTVTYDPAVFAQAYQKHIQYVQNYFVQRPQDLLIMNIPNGDGWEKLCPFLGFSIPDQPFVRQNIAGEPENLNRRNQNQNRIANLVEKGLGNCLN